MSDGLSLEICCLGRLARNIELFIDLLSRGDPLAFHIPLPEQLAIAVPKPKVAWRSAEHIANARHARLTKINELKTKKFNVMRSKVNDDGSFKPRNGGTSATPAPAAGANLAIADALSDANHALEAAYGLAPGELSALACIDCDSAVVCDCFIDRVCSGCSLFEEQHAPIDTACVPVATARELGLEDDEDDVEEVEPGKQITYLDASDTINISLETDATKEVEISIETDDFAELAKSDELAL